MTIFYTDAQIVRMSDKQIEALAMLCPKRVFFQMETSGSPSVWTDYGEYEVVHTGEAIVSLARKIRAKHEDCTYNKGWDMYAHIRVVF